jgi:tellurite resistance protein TerA
MELIRGQKLKMADVVSSPAFEVSLQVDSTLAASVSCFCLDGDRKLVDDRYFIFYNCRESPCSSIVLQGDSTFKLNLSTLPESVKNIVFAVTLDEGGSMNSIGPSSLRLVSDGEEKFVFPFSGGDFSDERAIMAAEFYFKGEWRAAAIGQGFSGGLSALLERFGGKGIPLTPAPAPRVNLSKVTLEKRGESKRIDLAKKSQKPIHINLQWDEPGRSGRGFFAMLRGRGGGADLDLGCMFRLKNGDADVIQPLGGNFGSKDKPPYIFLDKDDRSGAASDGENMYIYRPEDVGLMVIFAMIYEGTAKFTAVSGRVTVKGQDDSEIVVPLNNPDERNIFCAVARIEPDGDGIRITKDELYFKGHQDCDSHYGFGFRWKPGKK